MTVANGHYTFGRCWRCRRARVVWVHGLERTAHPVGICDACESWCEWHPATDAVDCRPHTQQEG